MQQKVAKNTFVMWGDTGNGIHSFVSYRLSKHCQTPILKMASTLFFISITCITSIKHLFYSNFQVLLK
jgi:hypothetical protein